MAKVGVFTLSLAITASRREIHLEVSVVEILEGKLGWSSITIPASGGRVGGSAFSSRSSSRKESSYSSCSSSRKESSYSSCSSYDTSSYSSPNIKPSSQSTTNFAQSLGFAEIIFLMIILFIAVILVTVVSGSLIRVHKDDNVIIASKGTTVLKLQVGLLGTGRTLQRDFNQITETADTSSSPGLSYVLSDTALTLLRHHEYCISGYTSVHVKKSIEAGEKCFNQLSTKERAKFDEETLVNVNNIKRKSTESHRASGINNNEYIVITIMVAAEGVHKLPTIKSSGELKKALQKLGAIPRSQIMAVEVLWTPQQEKDTLSKRELLKNYPLLTPL